MPDGMAVICAGHACVDIVMHGCDELPSREGHAACEAFSIVAGGSVSNCGGQLAALGLRAEAMARLGSDDFADLLLRCWKKTGISTGAGFVSREAGAPTSCAALPVYKADAKRAVYGMRKTVCHILAADLCVANFRISVQM